MKRLFIWGVMLGLLCRFMVFGDTGINKNELAQSVRQQFLHAWQGYKKYAWGQDDLKPLSKSYHNWYQTPLLMTPVDAFDTMLLMGLKEEAGEAKKLILTRLSFDRNFYVKHFEIVIRMLGGLIAAYQLDGDQGFLKLAVDLADRLLPAFSSPTGMPYVDVHLQTGKTRGKVSNPAEIGTLLLEYGTLSRLTGDPKYYRTAKKAVVELDKHVSAIGLVGTKIDVETGEWVDRTAHIGARIDSYYEYLLKSWLLFGDRDLKRMWETGIRALNRYLAHRTDTGLWYGQADMDTGRRLHTRFGALDAFFPAVLALGGDVKRAAQLHDSCFKMWQRHGIEPEMIDYSTMTVVRPHYVLRPENIESAYYLYAVTGEKKYLRRGKIFLDSLIRFCKTDAGFAPLESVVTKRKGDHMESFFLAETLKYLYLLFAPPDTLDFKKVIFNTEAHPLEIRGR